MTRAIRREIPRAGGAGRAVLVTVLIFAALFVALDFGLRFWAEQWLEDRIGGQLGVSEPKLSLGGFPFVYEFARGRLSSVGLEVRDLEAGGIEVSRVGLDLERVSFDRSDLLTRRAGEIAVGGGTGEVEIAEGDLQAFLAAQGLGVTVDLLGPRVRASATVEVGGQQATASGVGRVRLQGDRLVFVPGQVEVDGAFGVPPAALSFEIALPELFLGAGYESLEVTGDALVVRVSVTGATFDVG